MQKTTWSLAMIVATLSIFSFGCSENEPTAPPDTSTGDASLDTRLWPENWIADSLSPQLEERIRQSPITQRLENNMARSLTYQSGGQISPADPTQQCFDIGLVPLASESGSASFYHYTHDPVSDVETARVIAVIQGRGTNTLRVYDDVDMRSYIDIEVDENGIAVGIDGPLAQKDMDWECVATRVITIINLGGSTGLTAACIDACVLGGPTNPVCLSCVIGAAGTLGWILWDCYSFW